MDDYYRYLKTMVFPVGTKPGLAAAGFYILRPGDYVFCRNIGGFKKEEDNRLQFWVTPKGKITRELHAGVHNTREAALGDRKMRTATKPHKRLDGTYEGGTPFESHDHLEPVANSQRCYTLAQSYQVQRNTVGPTAAVKIAMGQEPSAHLRLREQIIQAAAPLAIASLEVAPHEISDALKLQADVTNLPRIGFDNNYAFPTMQLNLAPVQRADTQASSRMQKDLGNFGGKHLDHNDSEGGYTSMITYSDLAEDDDPGYFIVLDLGIAVLLEGLVVINFCGLRWHGGYPPTAAPGKKPKCWAYRFTIVCYPPHSMLNGSAVLSFAALPGKKFFWMPPEFIDPRHDDTPIQTNVANWINSGYYLTSPKSFLQFYYQGLCQIAHHFGRQVPQQARMEVDFKKLVECFSGIDKDGARHHAQFWELHPGSTLVSEEYGCTRKEAVKAWDDCIAKQSECIPYAVYKQLQKKGKPKAATQKGPKQGGTPRRPKAAGAKNAARVAVSLAAQADSSRLAPDASSQPANASVKRKHSAAQAAVESDADAELPTKMSKAIPRCHFVLQYMLQGDLDVYICKCYAKLDAPAFITPKTYIPRSLYTGTFDEQGVGSTQS
ncbi:hypothetical protein C8Q80DRAFT_1272880 [Daedaleopsis nitida]|nr:hypothetical protein C8Q80DRAFT_1272880 [Daedaleopsis nitida]